MKATAQVVPCDTFYTDPGLDQDYLPLTELSQQLSIDPAFRMVIDFSFLELGPGDTLEFRDALFPNQPPLALFTQGDAPVSVEAFSHSVWLHFSSDTAGQAAGYVFTIKCFDAYQFETITPNDTLCQSDTLQLFLTQDYPQTGPYTLFINQNGETIDSLSGISLIDSVNVPLPPSLNSGPYTLVLAPDSARWNPLSDSISIFLNPLPETPVVTGDSVYCGGIAWLQTAPADSLQWSYNANPIEGAFSSFIEVTEPGIYQVISTNGCGSALSDTLLLQLTPLPEPALLSIAGYQTLCQGDTLDIAVLNWDENSILVFNTNPISLSTPDFKAFDAGQYHVERSNTCGTSYSDTLSITVTQAPEPFTLNATGSLSFCEGGSVVLQPSLNLDAFLTWIFNGDTLSGANQSYTATQAGAYSLSASNSCGSTQAGNSLEVIVQENPPVPSIAAAGPTVLCEGSNAVLLVDVPPNTSFSWYRNGQTLNQQVSQLQATETGSYTVITTNSCGTAEAPQPIEVQINPLPDAPFLFAQGNPYLCNGSSVLVGTTPQSNVTWHWERSGVSIPSTTNSVVVTQPGVYTLSVTNGCGTVQSVNQIDVQTGNAPVTPGIQTTGTTSFCDGLAVTLTTTPQPGLLIEWLRNQQPTGLTDYQIQATEAGIWSVRVSNACDTLVSSQTVQVTVFPLPPSVTIQYAGETSLCEGDTLTFSIPPLANVSYQWRRNGAVVGPNAPEYTATEEGLYEIVLANNCGSTPSANSIYLNIDSIQPANPDLVAMPGTALCPGGYVLLNAPPVDFQQYSWYLNGNLIEGTNGPVLQATEWGTYTVQSGNSCGISGTSLGVTLGPGDPPPAFELYSEANETEFCSNDSLTITAQVPFGVSVRWYWNGTFLLEGDVQIAVQEPGTYTADAWNGCGESNATNSLELTTIPAPAIPVISQNNELLTTSALGDLQWLNAALEPIAGASGAMYAPPGVNASYFVQVTAQNGCSSISEPFAWLVDGIEHTVQIGKVYPNPARGSAVFQSFTKPQNLQLINTLGMVVKSFPDGAFNTSCTLQLNDIAPGYYWLKSDQGMIPLIVAP